MAITGNVINENFDARLHRVPFRKFTMEGMENFTSFGVHTRFLNVAPTSNKVEQDMMYSGLPPVPLVASDLLPSPLVDFKIGNPVTYRQNNYRYAYMFTRKAQKWDKVGVIAGVVGSMGKGMAYTMEVAAHEILNRATDTTYPGGQDNLTLGNAAHTIIGTSQTYDNVGTPGAYPTQALLQEIYSYFRRIPDDSGYPITVEIEAVITTPELAPAWRQLVDPTTQVGPGTGVIAGNNGVLGNTAPANANVKNAFAGFISPDKIVESIFLTNTGTSIIIGRGHHLNMFVGEAPRTRTWNVDNPEAIAHEITADFVVGWTDPRRIYVVPGA